MRGGGSPGGCHLNQTLPAVDTCSNPPPQSAGTKPFIPAHARAHTYTHLGSSLSGKFVRTHLPSHYENERETKCPDFICSVVCEDRSTCGVLVQVALLMLSSFCLLSTMAGRSLQAQAPPIAAASLRGKATRALRAIEVWSRVPQRFPQDSVGQHLVL